VNLNDDDIAMLDARAAGTAAELNAFLDEACAADSWDESHDSVHTGVLIFRPVLFKDHLNSQDVGMLLTALANGEVMDRVLACLRLLRIPESQLPQDAPADLMAMAQRRLSNLLVEHPVLMHNRIFVKSLHFASGAEFGPIASVIGATPRAQFPRLCHGVPLEKLRTFARHHCVRTGLTAEAPSPRGKDAKYHQMQGKTLLGSFAPNLHMPRPGILTSILELDDHRAASFPATRRPASFLSCRGQTAKQLHTCVANTLLAAFNISPLLPAGDSSKPFNGTNYDPVDFLKVLKSSGMARQPWLLQSVEANLYRWVSLPAEQVGPAFMGLAYSLAELKPVGLTATADGADQAEMKDVVRWLVKATLDSSSERAASVGLSFKNFPSVGGEKAVAFIDALERAAPEVAGHGGELQTLIELSLADMLGEAPEVWRASLRVHNMQSVMRRCAGPETDVGPAVVSATSGAPNERWVARRSRAL